MLTAAKSRASTYRLFAALSRAFRKAAYDAANPVSQITKPDANGKAIRWHGYVAREGLGITRTRNHISDANPTIGSISMGQRRFVRCA